MFEIKINNTNKEKTQTHLDPDCLPHTGHLGLSKMSYCLVVLSTIYAHFLALIRAWPASNLINRKKCVFIQKLKQIFEEGLELQKAHLREQRAHSKELLQENYRKYQNEIEAMENYYRGQVKQCVWLLS